MFGGATGAMMRVREHDRAPFDVLDEEIGWDRLVASREEITALGGLATQRYLQLRRYRSPTMSPVGSANRRSDAPSARSPALVSGSEAGA